MAAQRCEPRGTDPAHLVQLRDRAEPAVLGAVVDDPLASAGPIPSSVSSCSSVAEFSETGAAGDAPCRICAPRQARAPRPARHDHLLAVGQARRQVEARRDRRARPGPAFAHGVEHPRARREAIDAGAPTAPLDVDDDDLRPGAGAATGGPTPAWTGIAPPPPPRRS